MNIVIVGAGNVGRALAIGWIKAGRKISLAVRDADMRVRSVAFAPPDRASSARAS